MKGEEKLTKATGFMRDNVSGDRVRSGNVTDAGGLIYRMESGNIYRLSPAEVAVLQRFNFTPRYLPAGRQALAKQNEG